MFLGKINIKDSILDIIEKNNLEILKIDLCNISNKLNNTLKA